MSLDLDIKIHNGIKLKHVLIDTRNELIKITKYKNLPEMQSYILKQGSKYMPNDDYILNTDDMVIIKPQNCNNEVILVVTELEFYPPYITQDKVGIWAGISVQGANDQKLLLAASIALCLSKLCNSCILDERTVWSNKRQSTYNEFSNDLKISKIWK